MYMKKKMNIVKERQEYVKELSTSNGQQIPIYTMGPKRQKQRSERTKPNPPWLFSSRLRMVDPLDAKHEKIYRNVSCKALTSLR